MCRMNFSHDFFFFRTITMMKRSLFTLAGTLVLLALTKAQSDSLFPLFDGYRILHAYPVYHADDLWDYIDGAADNYLNYRFRELQIAEYAKGKDRIYYKVEVYRHADPLYAFGIYSSERSSDYRFVDVGTEGFREEGQLFFLKGSCYVKVMAVEKARGGEEELEALARAVAARIPGPASFPAPLQLFPEQGKIAHSERFIASNFLGYSFFSEVFTATYRQNNLEFQMFLVVRDDPSETEHLLKALYDKTEDPPPATLQQGDHLLHDKYNGKIYLIWNGRLLFGFLNIDDSNLIRPLAAELLEKYKSSGF